MNFRAKWTAVTFIALTALGAGSVAFAGCTVTSGKVDDIEAGPVTPTDSSTPPSDGSTSDAGGGTCEGNTKQKKDLNSAACQAALNEECCMELKGCFGQDVDPLKDCNVYAACYENCNQPVDGGAAPSDAEFTKCVVDFCDSNSPKSVQDAFDAINECAKAGNKSHTACQ